MEENKNTNLEQAILEVAERLFLEKGFAMTSTTEIAKEAGCNQGLVHYYYRTKEKLFEEVFSKKAELFFSAFMNVENEELPFRGKLRRVIEVHFDMLMKNPRLPFLLINEFTTNPGRVLSVKEKIKNLPESVLAKMEKELKEEIRCGRIREIELVDLMLMIISLNGGLFIAKPIMGAIMGMGEEEWERLAKRRRDENVRIILQAVEG
ncbi:MAG TPA: TetR/AcrR family transcriptional regulator [Ignavibacteriaceae bacterium]|mgnify:FL=1|nr:TetR/AcrR family transcriptional regulator [Ignavibacteriaceae bacterium]